MLHLVLGRIGCGKTTYAHQLLKERAQSGCDDMLLIVPEQFTYESDKGVVNTWRIWWVQAETVVGFLNGYKMNPDKPEYLEAAENEWKFIKDYVIDKRSGSEWYWEVDEEGKPYPDRPIVEPWKCPYHNGRMCLEVIKRSE